MQRTPTARELSEWLAREGMVETGDSFPDDGDLFASGLDSMAVMQLVVAAEEAFGVVLGPADLTRDNLRTPQSLAALFSEKIQPS
jgi:acyl carrier protein